YDGALRGVVVIGRLRHGHARRGEQPATRSDVGGTVVAGGVGALEQEREAAPLAGAAAEFHTFGIRAARQRLVVRGIEEVVIEQRRVLEVSYTLTRSGALTVASRRRSRSAAMSSAWYQNRLS